MAKVNNEKSKTSLSLIISSLLLGSVSVMASSITINIDIIENHTGYGDDSFILENDFTNNAKISATDYKNAEAITFDRASNVTITNNGTIHAEVTSNNLIDSAGIRIGSITNSTITNGANGVISSYGYGSASDTTVVALNPGGEASATNIQNDGKIEAKLNDMLR